MFLIYFLFLLDVPQRRYSHWLRTVAVAVARGVARTRPSQELGRAFRNPTSMDSRTHESCATEADQRFDITPVSQQLHDSREILPSIKHAQLTVISMTSFVPVQPCDDFIFATIAFIVSIATLTYGILLTFCLTTLYTRGGPERMKETKCFLTLTRGEIEILKVRTERRRFLLNFKTCNQSQFRADLAKCCMYRVHLTSSLNGSNFIFGYSHHAVPLWAILRKINLIKMCH
jgi:hypothetical protein